MDLPAEQAPSERRDSYRAEVRLPIAAAPLNGPEGPAGLATLFQLDSWWQKQRVLTTLDDDFRAHLDHVQDMQAAQALRTLEHCVRELANMGTEPAIPGQTCTANLSAEGISFALNRVTAELRTPPQPDDWWGLCITLPDGYHIVSSAQVVWMDNDAGWTGMQFVNMAADIQRILSRFLLLQGASPSH